MKTRVRLSVLALLLVSLSAFGASKKDDLDSLFAKYSALKQFNGSALVANRDGIILKKGYGFANLEWQIPNAADTKFRLGSITKQFTSMLIMQLVAEGKIKLDEKMTTYLPDYRADTGNRVTIRHLLTHTSGIPSYTNQPDFFQKVSRDPYSVADFVKAHTSGDLEFEPGSKFAYDNSGYFLLGAIIERVTGKPYEEVLRQRIFDPLGMKDSGYDHWATVLPKRATGYELTPNGYRNAAYLDMSIPYAAGSLYSTVEDLYRWDRALYETTLLSEELKATMYTPALQNYAFGWAVGPLKLQDGKTEVKTIRHNGGINGFSTVLVRVPDTRELVVLLDNTSRGDKLDEIAAGALSVLHGITPRGPRKSVIDAVMSNMQTGVEKAIEDYRELKRTRPDEYDFNEADLNRVGYTLLAQGRNTDAIAIFKLNVEMYPQSSNTYDSLGEAYMVHGDHDNAVANYKKSLELNPKNTNATEKLEQLAKPPAEKLKLDLDRYVGRYELAPNFVLTITHEGDALKAQATGQPKLSLVAASATEFDTVGVAARLVFTLGESGPATALTLKQGGREIPGKRIE